MNADTTGRLRILAAQATPGPWTAKPYLYADKDGRIRVRVTSPSDSDDFNLADDVLPADAEYIAAASPEVMLGLIDALADAQMLSALTEDTEALIRGGAAWQARAEAAEAKLARIAEALYTRTMTWRDTYDLIHSILTEGANR